MSLRSWPHPLVVALIAQGCANPPPPTGGASRVAIPVVARWPKCTTHRSHVAALRVAKFGDRIPPRRSSMEHITLLIGIVIVTALVFDFTNGFHDTANAMATTISTGALGPRIAV